MVEELLQDLNLVTKKPTAEREITAMVNANITSAADISAYYAAKYGKTGLKIFASSNLQKQYDTDKDDFSDISHFTSSLICFNKPFVIDNFLIQIENNFLALIPYFCKIKNENHVIRRILKFFFNENMGC